jgi:hypothetical protein
MGKSPRKHSREFKIVAGCACHFDGPQAGQRACPMQPLTYAGQMFLRVTLLILAAFLSACSSGGGGIADLRASDLEGTWLVSLTTTSLVGASCDPASGIGNSGLISASVIVVGSVATVVLDGGTTYELDLVGSRAARTTVVSFVDAAGLTNTTKTTLDVGVSGTQMTGAIVVLETRGDGNATVTLCREETAVTGEKQLVPPADFGGEWDVTLLVLSSTCGIAPGEADVSRLLLAQEGLVVAVSGGYGGLLAPDNNGSMTGIVTGDTLRLFRNDGFTQLTLTLRPDGISLSGAGQVRRDESGTGVFGGLECDLEVSVTATKSLPTTAEMWINFENGLADATGNGFDGQAIGDFVIDTSNGAAGNYSGAFDGFGDGVSVANSASLAINTGTAFSFGVWVRPSILGPYQTILAKSPAVGVPITASMRTPALYLNAGQAVYGYFNGEAVFGTVLLIGEWSHIGVVYDGAVTHTIYVNGSEASVNPSMPAANEAQNGEGPWTLTFGQSFNTFPLDYPGNIDDVTFWSRALSAIEMQALYQMGPVGL